MLGTECGVGFYLNDFQKEIVEEWLYINKGTLQYSTRENLYRCFDFMVGVISQLTEDINSVSSSEMEDEAAADECAVWGEQLCQATQLVGTLHKIGLTLGCNFLRRLHEELKGIKCDEYPADSSEESIIII